MLSPIMQSDTFPEILRSTLTHLSCQTGTIHRTTPDGQHLELVCQTGVPDFLLERISYIPFGKGIAGVAASSGEPVELCNLQEHLGGVAKSAARQTGVSGSIAVPVFSENTGAVIGTLGVGMQAPHDFTAEEKALLAETALKIARGLENPAG